MSSTRCGRAFGHGTPVGCGARRHGRQRLPSPAPNPRGCRSEASGSLAPETRLKAVSTRYLPLDPSVCIVEAQVGEPEPRADAWELRMFLGLPGWAGWSSGSLGCSDPVEGMLRSSLGTGDRWKSLPEASSVRFAGARKKAGGFPGPRVDVLGWGSVRSPEVLESRVRSAGDGAAQGAR